MASKSRLDEPGPSPAMSRPSARTSSATSVLASGTGPRRAARETVVAIVSPPARSIVAARAVSPSSQGVEKRKWSFADTAAKPPSRAASTAAWRRASESPSDPNSMRGRWTPSSTRALAHLLARGLQQLLGPRELHAWAAFGLPRGALGAVDRLPARVGHVVGLALVQELLERVGVGFRGIQQAAGGSVLQQRVDRLLRVALVGADDPARAALDPADHVLAAVADATTLVGDYAAAVVERHPL